RTETADGFQVRVTTAENRVSTYLVENLPTGDERRIETGPDGLSVEQLSRTNGEVTSAGPDGTVSELVIGPDPRWGMQAPFVASLTVTAPSGQVSSFSATKTVSLANASNPLSLLTQSNTFTVNGRTYTTAFNAATRTFNQTTPEGRQAIFIVDGQG